MIDVKVFEECFKESNKGKSKYEQNLTEESCNCDWIIFAIKPLNSFLVDENKLIEEEKLMCLIEVDIDGKEDKNVWIGFKFSESYS